MKKYLYLPFVLAAILITVFICRAYNKPDEVIKPTDTTSSDRRADSLRKISLQHQDTAKIYRKQCDSLLKVLNQNHQNLKHEIKAIQNLTPDGLDRFHDSLMRSIGYRQ